MKIIIFIGFLIYVSQAFPGDSDKVLILPGLRIQPTFKHYSGYLNGSDTRMLHYWFVESQNNSNTDPLVLWMNGGPGCSSLDGLLTEHGPFRITNGGFLDYNPYSWNKIANIIYLESPACVGFSYSTDGKCDASDDTTSLLNYNALKHFFVKFPQYKNRDFYITGESYGGYYVPTLAERVVNSKDTPYMKLKGIAVGNGLSSISVIENGNIHFAYNHALVGDRYWRNILLTCCNNTDPLSCDIADSKNVNCQAMVVKAMNQLHLINVYNIYGSCASSPDTDNYIWDQLGVASYHDRLLITMGWIGNSHRLTKLRQKYITLKTIQMVYRKDVSMNIPCINASLPTDFLNRPRVRYALHIPQSVANWTICSGYVNHNYIKIYPDMNSQYNHLFAIENFKIWIYNGDVDMACSYLGEEWYFEAFNREVIQDRRPWMYEDKLIGPQIGGFVKKWDKFSLITVRGAGHMVPTDRPYPAFHLFDSFIKGKDL